MFDNPGYYNDMSLRLSEVLDDIGVNQRMVLKRRLILLQETMRTITYNTTVRLSLYNFGSLTEGTTTLGLNSDFDTLNSMYHFNVIQNYTEWKQGYANLLMIQDDTTSPGYCLLQLIRSDVPLPATFVLNEHFVKVSRDRVFLKNTIFDLLRDPGNRVKHGPSWSQKGELGFRDVDYVPAFPCKSWPYEARGWLHRQDLGRWPTPEMKRYAENSGCFVVPVGNKVSQNEALEWRISTSLAERCLMFSLNITQIRCYVLMKMILKTYLNPPGECHLSSFMCKTVMLYCIENTHSSLWVEHNLLRCLSQCLHAIFTCLLQGNCPHFIIPGNNLMAGRFSVVGKHKILDNLCYIIQSNGLALLWIQTDDLGHRLQTKLNMIHQTVQTFCSPRDICLRISGGILLTTAEELHNCYKKLLHELSQHESETAQLSSLQYLHRYTRMYRDGNMLERTASSFLVQFICSSLGTFEASSNIHTNNTISQKALALLSAGLNADVSSGRIKLASVMYCMGYTVRTEAILKDIERRYNYQAVEPICGCYSFAKHVIRREFTKVCNNQPIAQAIRTNTAFCISFTPAEIHCVPHELQYEMFRSTQDDLKNRTKYADFWMDWAVVDSLPYLYFLQYKTYGQLHQNDGQHQALNNLIRIIGAEPNFGHRETALNLLGQCMEQENQVQNALRCYMKSLNIRKRNNAARYHICKLLANIVNYQQTF